MERAKLKKSEQEVSGGREKLKYIPQWEGPVEGHAVNYIRKNLWRMRARCEFADLYQEAWLAFDFVRKRFTDVKNPQHFMRLFKMRLPQHFCDIRQAHEKNAGICFCEIPEDQLEADSIDELQGKCFTAGDAELVARMNEVPALLAPIFQYFCDVEEIQRLMDSSDVLEVPKPESCRKRTKNIWKKTKLLQGDELYWEIIRRSICKFRGQNHKGKKSFHIPIGIKNRISIRQLLLRWYYGQ